MQEIKNRANLYTTRQKQRRDNSRFFWQSFHTEYLVGFWRNYKKNIIMGAVLSFVAILIEVFVLLLGRIIIRQLSIRLEIVLIWQMLGLLLFALIIYLVVSYFSIKVEKTILIELLNDLRRKWVSKVLNKRIFTTKSDSKQSIIAKLFYHFSLVAMGFNQSLVGLWRILLLFILVVVLATTISFKMFIVAIITIVVSIGLFIVGYFISKNYVSREQTLYTHILKHIVKSFDNLSMYKLHQQEKKVLFKLDNLVELDMWFRVRRDLWMKYGNEVLFAFIVLGGAAIYILQLYLPEIFDQEISSLFFYGIVITYMLRLLYLSLRAGLFFIPFKLGLQLSIPESYREYDWGRRKIDSFCLKADKVKLPGKDVYYKDNNFCMNFGSTYLFKDKNRDNLTYVTALFVGMKYNNAKPWILHVNNERYLYNDWFGHRQLNYLISPDLKYSGSVGEFIFGLDQKDVDLKLLEVLYDKFAEYDVFDYLFKNNRILTARMEDFTITERALLQIIYAVHHGDSVIIIDSYLIDLNDPVIEGGIKILRKLSPNAIIVTMSTRDNIILDYEETFSFKK